ncbi:MAG TPA: HIT family protein [Burkholderiaceae bacterium]|jgi:histidine triad (HIT) family protein|nr:HIT family protein [Burkholderiaceae bacterium]HRA77928.1 HIT family protein [Burkholderiaceae bacterium]
MPTVFERLYAGELPCARIYSDEHVFAFMDAGQVNDGHVIVASIRPYPTLMDADEETAVAMMRAARRIAIAVEREFAADGVTLLQANRVAGWQTVPHLHLHVLPRRRDDAVTLGWPRRDPSFEKLQALAARVRL